MGQHLLATENCNGLDQCIIPTFQNLFRLKQGSQKLASWELSDDYYPPSQFGQSIFAFMRNSRDQSSANYQDAERHTIILFRPQAEFRTMMRKYSL